MSKAVIRYWLGRFLTDKEFGWAVEGPERVKSTRILAEFLGFSSLPALQRVASKEREMSLLEQKRLARRLDSLLSGEFVCRRRAFPTRHGDRVWFEAAVADDPKPLKEVRLLEAFVSVTSKGVKVGLQPNRLSAPADRMPTFGEIFQKIRS
jgi:hypothetical protein